MGASLTVDVIPTGEIGMLLDMNSTGGVITDRVGHHFDRVSRFIGRCDYDTFYKCRLCTFVDDWSPQYDLSPQLFQKNKFGLVFFDSQICFMIPT